MQARRKSVSFISKPFRVFSHCKVSRWPPSAVKKGNRGKSQKPKQGEDETVKKETHKHIL